MALHGVIGSSVLRAVELWGRPPLPGPNPDGTTNRQIFPDNLAWNRQRRRLGRGRRSRPLAGGRLLVLDTDWGSIVWHSRDAERMRRVLAAGMSTSSIPISPGG